MEINAIEVEKMEVRIKNKNTFQKIKNKKLVFITLMLIWPLIQFAIFWVYVNIDTVILSFQRFNVAEGVYKFASTKNFVELFQSFSGYPSRLILDATLNSVYILLFNTFILLPLSLVSAYALYKKVFMSSVYRVIFFLPSIISVVVLTIVFKFMFDPNLGLISPILKFLNLEYIIPKDGWFASINTAFSMVLLYCLWAGIGYNVLLLSGALTRIPLEIIESARLDGIGFFKEFLFITLPLIAPTISTLIIMGISSAFKLFLQPMMLTGGGPNGSTFTIMYYIVSMVKQGGNGVASGATVGVFFSIFAIPLVMGTQKIFDKIFPNVEF